MFRKIHYRQRGAAVQSLARMAFDAGIPEQDDVRTVENPSSFSAKIILV